MQTDRLEPLQKEPTRPTAGFVPGMKARVPEEPPCGPTVQGTEGKSRVLIQQRRKQEGPTTPPAVHDQELPAAWAWGNPLGLQQRPENAGSEARPRAAGSAGHTRGTDVRTGKEDCNFAFCADDLMT